jgi:tetratricopeptide (TPR) repeat protein
MAQQTGMAADNRAFSQLLDDGMNAIRQEQWQRAEQLLDKSLVEAEKFGKNDRRVGESLVNLGVIYGHRKDWARAIAVSRRALDIDIKVHGEKHADVAYDYHQLGSYLDFAGKHTEATPYLKRALELRQSLPDMKPSLVGVTAENLAENMMSLKRTAEGESLDRLALTCFKKDENARCYFSRLDVLCDFYSDPKRAKEGKNFYKAELADLDRRFGSDSPWSANFLNRQGPFAMKTKDYALAESTYRRLTAMSSKLPGGSPVKAAMQNALAVALFQQGKYDQAAPCFKQAASLLEGANMPEQTRLVKLDYAKCLEKLGKVKEAAELRR